MKRNFEELELLFKKIQENRAVQNVTDNISLEELKKICDASPRIVVITKISKLSMSLEHSNKNACDLLDATNEEISKQGFKYILKIVHPDNLSAIFLAIKFFNDANNKHKLFSNTFYVNTKNGWVWMYVTSKSVIFNKNGTAKYTLSVATSLDEVLKTRKQNQHLRKNLNFYEENMEKYLSMTKREKEILILIAKEFTTEEIAEKLSISTATVDTHRRNLIEKFNVKSAIGLAKYAISFNLT